MRITPRVLAERYRLIRHLGGGGMGVVYEGEIVRTGLRVAVKMLHPLLARDEKARLRLIRECELVQRVEHDALVPIIDIDEDVDGTPFLVMELLRGEDLRQRLTGENRIALRDAIWIAWNVADALEAVHEAGVIHRDLKPDNVFLQLQRHIAFRVRLLDFGIAKARERVSISLTATRDGGIIGTPAYMAPEQASGQKHFDARTDVYGLGVVLYEMLTGRSPYPGGDDATPLAMLDIIRQMAPIPLREIRPDAPRSLESFLARALSKRPEDRFGSMAEVKSALSIAAAEPLPGAPVDDLDWGDEGKLSLYDVISAAESRSAQAKSSVSKRGRRTTPNPP